MALELAVQENGKTIEVKASGKLTKEDYQRFVPEVERLVKRHGKIRVLFEMRGFHGWTAGALWQDIKFDLKHFSDIERLALVGEAKWRRAWRSSASLSPRRRSGTSITSRPRRRESGFRPRSRAAQALGGQSHRRPLWRLTPEDLELTKVTS